MPAKHQLGGEDDQGSEEEDAGDLGPLPLPPPQVEQHVDTGGREDDQEQHPPEHRDGTQHGHEVTSAVNGEDLAGPAVDDDVSADREPVQRVVDGDDGGHLVLAGQDGQVRQGRAGLRDESGQAGESCRQRRVEGAHDEHPALGGRRPAGCWGRRRRHGPRCRHRVHRRHRLHRAGGHPRRSTGTAVPSSASWKWVGSGGPGRTVSRRARSSGARATRSAGRAARRASATPQPQPAAGPDSSSRRPMSVHTRACSSCTQRTRRRRSSRTPGGLGERAGRGRCRVGQRQPGADARRDERQHDRVVVDDGGVGQPDRTPAAQGIECRCWRGCRRRARVSDAARTSCVCRSTSSARSASSRGGNWSSDNLRGWQGPRPAARRSVPAGQRRHR